MYVCVTTSAIDMYDVCMYVCMYACVYVCIHSDFWLFIKTSER